MSKMSGTPINTVQHDRQRTGLSGELFAAAELAKRGYTVSITFGNTKAIDLLVEKDTNTIAVQVKTISTQKSGSWILPYEQEKIPHTIIFLFVLLNPVNVSPEYFIMTAPEVIKNSTPFEKSNRRVLTLSKAKPHSDCWEKLELKLHLLSIA